jgi:hypothetical protein
MVQRGEQRGADVNIEDADILVAGGRGLGGRGLRAREELAEGARRRGRRDARGRRRRLVPVRGADRPDRQDVAPKLYLALRHLGRDPAQGRHAELENIVAINKDPNAPIFEFSDLGVVGDLHKIVPKLTELVKAKKGVRRRPERVPAAGRRREEFVAAPTDPEDERIEVGVAIVGGGPAGLACAIRLRQLLEDEPELPSARRGAGRGAREGQGARRAPALGRGVNPRALRELFPDLTRGATGRSRTARSTRRPSTT